ncbi:hypothetical protein ACFJIX_17900 [Roseateles sp. UC29_93]|uniref:hypothetical protein n=1 Tax=Roseateles sp. UC29_93 TaxID=3350177 RepID=UPI003670B08B
MSAGENLARDLAIALGLDTKDLAEATIRLRPNALPTVIATYYVRQRESIVGDDGSITTRVAKLKLVATPAEGDAS